MGGWPVGYLHNAVKELNSGLPRTNPDKGKKKDLNQGPADFKSSDLKHSAKTPPIDIIERFETTASSKGAMLWGTLLYRLNYKKSASSVLSLCSNIPAPFHPWCQFKSCIPTCMASWEFFAVSVWIAACKFWWGSSNPALNMFQKDLGGSELWKQNKKRGNLSDRPQAQTARSILLCNIDFGADTSFNGSGLEIRTAKDGALFS